MFSLLSLKGMHHTDRYVFEDKFDFTIETRPSAQPERVLAYEKYFGIGEKDWPTYSASLLVEAKTLGDRSASKLGSSSL